MPYSVTTNGKVEDIRFIKTTNLGWIVRLGGEYLGTVTPIAGAWTAVGKSTSPFNMVPGFASRRHAMEHLLRLRKYDQLMQQFKE